MQLENLLTEEEKVTVGNLITVHLEIQNLQAAIQEVKHRQYQIASKLTGLWWEDDENADPTSAMPQSFVFYQDGMPYLVSLDEDGEHNHTVTLIGGVCGYKE